MVPQTKNNLKMAEEQETLTDFSDKVKEQLSDYVQVKMDLLKAQWVEKIALLFSKLLTVFILLFVLFLTILFGSLVTGFYLGDILGSLKTGFAVIALFYVVLLGLLFFFRKRWIQHPVADSIVSTIYQNNDEE
jgi:uncharacterized BrkB/YihY/UPF0761 family membrane protein